jgi:hypothetical protein
MSASSAPEWDAALWSKANTCMMSHPELGDPMTTYKLRFELGRRSNWEQRRLGEMVAARERLAEKIETYRRK